MKLIHRLFIVSVLAVFLSGLALGSPVPVPETALTQTADPVLVGAGDIANCGRTQDESTAQLLDGIAGTIVTLGDNAYPDGTLTQFNDCYGPTWGRHKDRTRPSPGNHDYQTAGAAGYYTYFGAAASPLEPNCTSNCTGYYSYNLGDWHIIALNSEITRSVGSAQEQWLRTDLAANQSVCTLAYWHKPRFSSGQHGNNSSVQPFWQALYDYEADVVLNGHDHTYERFAPQNPSGQAEPTRGIREFVVGTGGASLYAFPTIQPNSEVRNNTTWGVLKLTLHPTRYDWEFFPIAGQTFTDAGSANCVSAGPAPTATPTSPVPTDTPTNTPTDTSTPGPSPTPTDTPTPTPTATATNTPTPTNTSTPGPSPTPTDTPTPTPTPTATPPQTTNPLYLSLGSGATVGGVPSSDEDILRFDGANWFMVFDGSDVGVGGVDLDAFYLVDADTILMSFDRSVTIGALVVDDFDIAQFDATSLGANTAGSFSLYFDGNDVELTTSGEDVDAIELLPDGRLLISTSGSPMVTGVSNGRDEDLLAFTPITLGDTTSGTWAMYFEGSDVELATNSGEDVDAVAIAANGDIYLSTGGLFAVTGVSGDDEDVFVCTPTALGSVTACTYSPTLYFDGSAWGLAANDVDAINLP